MVILTHLRFRPRQSSFDPMDDLASRLLALPTSKWHVHEAVVVSLLAVEQEGLTDPLLFLKKGGKGSSQTTTIMGGVLSRANGSKHQQHNCIKYTPMATTRFDSLP
jgi:hypothetical protein